MLDLFHLKLTSTIKVTGRSTGNNRNLIITDIYKKKLGQITFGSNAELKSTTINFTGTVFLYSENSNIDIYKIQIDTNSISSSNSNTSSSSSSSSTSVKDGIATITRNSESDLLAGIKKVNSNGGTVYINTPIISISSTSTINLSSSKSGGIIGIKQSDGTYPRIDFSNARNKGSTSRGITISGSNKYFKYIIIEHTGDNCIWISGSKNTLDHIITRYNNDTGIQLSDMLIQIYLIIVIHIEILILKLMVPMQMDLLLNLVQQILYLIIVSLRIIVMMVGIHLIKKVIIQQQ